MNLRGIHFLRSLLAVLAPLVVLAGGAFSCSRPAPFQDANIVILLVDTLRRDALDITGGNRQVSPALDRLGRESFVFTQAVAPSSWTKPSVASLLTGLYPGRHGAVRYPWHERVVGYPGMIPLDGRHETLAEALRSRGYRTAAFVTNPHIIPENRFDQGFDTFVQPAGDAAALLDRAMAWVDEAAAGEKPFFLYLHLIDPHSPYLPPEEYRKRFAPGDPGERAPFTRMGDPQGLAMWAEQFLQWEPGVAGEPFRFDYAKIVPRLKENHPELADQIDLEKISRQIFLDFAGCEDPLLAARVDYLISLYEGEVAYVDDAVEGFLTGLETRGLLDEILFVLTGDHGEAFFEHGIWGHGFDVHGEEIDVPLIFRVPRSGGAVIGRSDVPVSLVDLYPTLLEMTGPLSERTIDGASLWPFELGGSFASHKPRIVFCEVMLKYGDFVAARLGDWKVIRTHRPDDEVTWQCFDLSSDPTESKAIDIVNAGPEARDLQRAIERLIADRDLRFIAEDAGADLSEDLIRQMKALGYM